MRLLYLVLTPRGVGEVVIALAHADQLIAAGAEVQFVIGPAARGMVAEHGSPYRVIEPDAGAEARTLIEETILGYRPHAILLVDYFTYWVIADGQYGIDPWFIEKYDIPVLPVDIWEWERTTFELDIAEGLTRPVSRHIETMPVHLRPVPLAHLEPTGHGRPYRLMSGDDRVGAATRRAVRESLGLSAADRMVLVPVSAWQQPGERPAHPGVVALARHVPDLLAHYLDQLPDTAKVVFVGAPPPALAALPAARRRILPPCPAGRYSELIGSADLVLSLNPAAATLIRATLADVGGMFLTNGFPARSADDLARLEEATGGLTGWVRDWLAAIDGVGPFRLWPMSFSALMAPMLAGNPYLDAVAHPEILDERAVLAALGELLYDEPAQRRLAAARSTYRELVAGVPDAVAALRSAVPDLP